MNTKEKQIKLALAMGWTRITYPTAEIPWRKHDMWRPPNRKSVRYKNPPDPFTDANDDYAVLEWMRTQSHPLVKDDYRYLDAVAEVIRSAEIYEIGDYARAALKVIEND